VKDMILRTRPQKASKLCKIWRVARDCQLAKEWGQAEVQPLDVASAPKEPADTLFFPNSEVKASEKVDFGAIEGGDPSWPSFRTDYAHLLSAEQAAMRHMWREKEESPERFWEGELLSLWNLAKNKITDEIYIVLAFYAPAVLAIAAEEEHGRWISVSEGKAFKVTWLLVNKCEDWQCAELMWEPPLGVYAYNFRQSEKRRRPLAVAPRRKGPWTEVCTFQRQRAFRGVSVKCLRDIAKYKANVPKRMEVATADTDGYGAEEALCLSIMLHEDKNQEMTPDEATELLQRRIPSGGEDEIEYIQILQEEGLLPELMTYNDKINTESYFILHITI